jgi:CubicO group peptidase (beta-lactamase class C family)
MKSFVLLIFVLISSSLLAQDFNRAKMDSLFARIEANRQGMGSISIFADGQEVYQRAFGYASREEQIAADRGTVYRIGSITKTFTAAIIMKLIERGQLTLTTSLATFYPGIENAERITIAQMLRHRSGIFNYTGASDYASWMERPITKEALIAKIAGYKSAFAPGERNEYSNSNYALLSFIAEELTGKDFAQLIAKMVGEPCALQSTYYGGAISVANHEAQSYAKQTDWQPATETDASVLAGAGAMVSTPTDLNRFLTCLFSHQVVSAASLDSMMSIKGYHGMGLVQVPFYEKQAYGHTGGVDGFRSNAFYFPDERVSVAYLSNGVAMPLNDILVGVLSIYFGRDYTLPTFETLTLDTATLDEYVGVYSSPDFPLSVLITRKDSTLIGQATGQAPFSLEAYEVDKFKFDPAGLKLYFIAADNVMRLNQGGQTFELKRK